MRDIISPSGSIPTRILPVLLLSLALAACEGKGISGVVVSDGVLPRIHR